MKKRKIVIIRGRVTSGKSTTSHELAKVLPGWIFIDIWKIKEMFEPLGLKDRKSWLPITKKTMIVIIREVVRKLGLNIIIQESSLDFIKENLKSDLKDYRVYSFFLDVNVEDAVKRDIQREKPTMNVNKYNLSNEDWKKQTKVTPDKKDIIIDTSKNSIKEVVNIIIKSIGEKRRKHPNMDAIRKSW